MHKPHKPIRVLHIAGITEANGALHTGVPVGGGEIMLYQMLAHTDKGAVLPEVLTFYNKEDMKKQGTDDPRGEIGRRMEQNLGIKVHCLELAQPLGSAESSRAISQYIAGMKDAPDVVHTWLQHSRRNIAGVVKKPRSGALVWELQDGDPGFRIKGDDAKQNALMARALPDSIVCCSHKCADNYIELGYPRGKITTIDNMVPTHNFIPCEGLRERTRAELRIPGKAFVFGMAAQYIPRKDFPNFLRAAKAICDERPDAYFVLSGRAVTEDNEHLRKEIEKAGVPADHVRLLGIQDMRQIYPAFDVYTQTSNGEGLSLALLEAGSAGNILVATDVGGTKKAVGEVGTIIPPGDTQALVAAWKKIMDMSPEERRTLSEQTRSHIVATHDIYDRVAAYRALYEQLMARAPEHHAM